MQRRDSIRIRTLLFVGMVLSSSACALFSGHEKPTPAEEAAAAARNAPPNPAASLHSAPPDQVAIYTSLGTAYLQGGHPRAAVRELKQAISLPGKHGDAYNVLGLAYQALGEAALAESAFQSALSDEPGNPEFLNNYGAFLLEQGKFSAAIQQLSKATKDPLYNTPEYAWTNLAAAYRGLKQNNLAIVALQKALYFKPGYPPALLLWAEMEYQDKNFPAAYGHLQGVLAQEPNNAQALLLAGRIAWQQGQPVQARSLWERCVNADPYSAAGKEAQSLLLEHGADSNG
ncbi:type IV pilus biogenesis/stability protein PilW [Acidithiobacillus sp. CV18-2]|uniref:Type IV pilus biogenesis/stability protein PilW n=1 Tax=Igneacidithiobacillus copahuensis TaxID=2724909 RepID=A0AAE3CK53_9PROT|nr:type IV pilus biogenesis/stability protein PilW [Igneacidithiobacillus copahuensis]MBU2753520.1 type IV pilus biogenesis/stability protein PilW [Acidithiobacillus sp. CV18-3]MBU2757138.1 type IV pilus biogenesis/stability protein PilW [Acidithiobacillus sp. BN09-2]MBU2776014.1 type IV pilus biogenesis/stability protein PilW [Acidithiobacillus sp. CV18-2]MBU2795905.1 type IV pilus biogenesis/stability protein PilW [Acidithiobacillus sp. VAN18-2]MBU2800309.1 type IV pilus biogenesis/stability